MTNTKEILIPDIGDFEEVEVIDILVQPGDSVKPEDPLITLESDKATIDIPAPLFGIVRNIRIKIGDRVSEGMPLMEIEETEEAVVDVKRQEQESLKQPEPEPEPEKEIAPVHRSAPSTPTGAETVGTSLSSRAHASPSVRKLARELGADLGLIRGSGTKGRILKTDVMAFTKAVMSSDRVFQSSGGFSLPEIPPVDFSKFGPVETIKLSRLKRIGGQNLHRSWINVPHVTQFDEADITELEDFRRAKQKEAGQHGTKLTLLSFLIKAVVAALREYPSFNSSLQPGGEELTLKKYYHIGFAVNTDGGLMVPVIKDADQKGLFDLALELSGLAQKARDKQITPTQMQGACFTISSLGHIGGTGFTPIINTPEVAILGVSRSAIKPLFMDGKFVPRSILPFTLSYDHRVIDGVEAAEFTRYLGSVLSDIRQILL